MRRHTIIFVAREDKEFLWDWAQEIAGGPDARLGPSHLLAALVIQLRAERLQGKLFPISSETEAQALQIARAEWAESVEAIAIHAQEREGERKEAATRARLPGLVKLRRAA